MTEEGGSFELPLFGEIGGVRLVIALPANMIVSEGREKKKKKKKREKECWARVIARADGIHGWQGWWLFLYR